MPHKSLTGTSAVCLAQLQLQVQRVLPSVAAGGGPHLAPKVYYVRNQGLGNLLIYPSNIGGGGTEGNIDGRAAGVPFVLAPNASVMFIAHVQGTSTQGPTWMSMGYNGPRPVVHITAARTITKQESGTIFTFTRGTVGNYTITLPAVATAGQAEYTFIQKGPTADTKIVTITAGAATVVGCTVSGPTAGCTGVTSAGATNIVCGTACSPGTIIRLICDGTNYICSAVSPTGAAADCITFT